MASQKITSARVDAENLLRQLLDSQPNLIVGSGHSSLHGDKVASFCSAFVETYAKYLSTRTENA